MKFFKEPKPTLNDLIILSVLDNQNATGMEIHLRSKRSGKVVRLGSIYNCLRRLRTLSCVDRFLDENGDKAYQITRKGRRVLEDEKKALMKLWGWK